VRSLCAYQPSLAVVLDLVVMAGSKKKEESKKNRRGVSPAVFGDSLRCLLGVCAGLSGRWAVGEPKVRKINGAGQHGAGMYHGLI
jgi:hypothetical protein